jgi:hypothetical protein
MTMIKVHLTFNYYSPYGLGKHNAFFWTEIITMAKPFCYFQKHEKIHFCNNDTRNKKHTRETKIQI